jgi:hypothetical protein
MTCSVFSLTISLGSFSAALICLDKFLKYFMSAGNSAISLMPLFPVLISFLRVYSFLTACYSRPNAVIFSAYIFSMGESVTSKPNCPV